MAQKWVTEPHSVIQYTDQITQDVVNNTRVIATAPSLMRNIHTLSSTAGCLKVLRSISTTCTLIKQWWTSDFSLH